MIKTVGSLYLCFGFLKLNGAKPCNGYIGFKVGLGFKKRHYHKDLGDRKWMVEKVYLVEK